MGSTLNNQLYMDEMLSFIHSFVLPILGYKYCMHTMTPFVYDKGNSRINFYEEAVVHLVMGET